MEIPQKSVLLIDAAYLLKGWRSLKGEMDYNRLVTVLGEVLRLPKNIDGTYFWERHYFNSVPDPPRVEQNSFHVFLKKVPPEGPKMKVHLFPMKRFSVTLPSGEEYNTMVQKGVDVGIATKLLEHVYEDNCTKIALVAGDGDFKDAVVAATRRKAEVYVFAFNNRSLSADLQSEARMVFWLDDYWERLKKIDYRTPTQTV